jgi:hypothetical protein
VTGPEPVVFRTSRRRAVFGVASILLPVTVVIRGLFLVAAVATGISLDFSDYVEALVSVLAMTTAVGLGVLAGAGRNPGRVTMTAAGLEFVSPRHRATFLPWAGIAAARRRFAGPFTQLLVTPAGPEAFFHAQTPGRIPRLRGGAFVIDVGAMTPGPAALLAELNRHRAVPAR